MFSKKTRNLAVTVLALVMALSLGFGVMGFATKVNAATTSIEFTADNGYSGVSKNNQLVIDDNIKLVVGNTGTASLETDNNKIGYRIDYGRGVFLFRYSAPVTVDLLINANGSSGRSVALYNVGDVALASATYASVFDSMTDNTAVGTDAIVAAKTTSGGSEAKYTYDDTTKIIKFSSTGGLKLTYTLAANTTYAFGCIASGDTSTLSLYNIDITPAGTFYDVTFMVDDAQYGDKQSVKEGEYATAPADPSKEGFIFDGWEPAVESTQITQNTTFTAKWLSESEVDTNVVTIDYNNGSENVTKTIVEGSTIGVLADPERENYTFTGWTIDTVGGEVFDVESAINEDITIVANYTRNNITGALTDFRTGATAASGSRRAGYKGGIYFGRTGGSCSADTNGIKIGANAIIAFQASSSSSIALTLYASTTRSNVPVVLNEITEGQFNTLKGAVSSAPAEADFLAVKDGTKVAEDTFGATEAGFVSLTFGNTILESGKYYAIFLEKGSSNTDFLTSFEYAAPTVTVDGKEIKVTEGEKVANLFPVYGLAQFEEGDKMGLYLGDEKVEEDAVVVSGGVYFTKSSAIVEVTEFDALEDIDVDYLTKETDIPFVMTATYNGVQFNILAWTCENYNADLGTYVFTATIEAKEGYNVENATLTVRVNVNAIVANVESFYVLGELSYIPTEVEQNQLTFGLEVLEETLVATYFGATVSVKVNAPYGYVSENVTVTLVYNITGWDITTEPNGTVSDEGTVVTRAYLSNTTAQQNLPAYAIAIPKNAEAKATYTFAQATSIASVKFVLAGGSSNSFNGKIIFKDADGNEIATETPALAAGNWLANTFIYKGIENVKTIEVYGADKWIGITDFEITDYYFEATETLFDESYAPAKEGFEFVGWIAPSGNLEAAGAEAAETGYYAPLYVKFTMTTSIKLGANGGVKYAFAVEFINGELLNEELINVKLTVTGNRTAEVENANYIYEEGVLTSSAVITGWTEETAPTWREVPVKASITLSFNGIEKTFTGEALSAKQVASEFLGEYPDLEDELAMYLGE